MTPITSNERFRDGWASISVDAYLASEQVNNFKRVLDNTNSHQLLAVVATVHHERADETLDNWAQGLTEAFDLVATSSVWQIFSCFTFNWYIILEEKRQRERGRERRLVLIEKVKEVGDVLWVR